MLKQYGWLPDIPDKRDLLYSAIKPRISLFSRVDLRKNCSQVEYQGKLGSHWGKAGYFTMPFAYLETLDADFWTIRK